MKCLNCGYCCTMLAVPIVDDPAKGMSEGNMKLYYGDGRCPFLSGDVPGEFKCTIHDEVWYKKTPCAKHHGHDVLKNGECRFGAYIMQCMEGTIGSQSEGEKNAKTKNV